MTVSPTVEERLTDLLRTSAMLMSPDEGGYTGYAQEVLAAAKEHGLVIGEGELDAAWKEAEAAVDATDRHYLKLVRNEHPRRYYYAACQWIPGELGEDAGADTPAAALHALAERLRR